MRLALAPRSGKAASRDLFGDRSGINGQEGFREGERDDPGHDRARMATSGARD